MLFLRTYLSKSGDETSPPQSFQIVFYRSGRYLSFMRKSLAGLVIACAMAVNLPIEAATSSLLKVLPEFLDLKGRNSLSPSLYERDVYQVMLRDHPERRSGIRFYIEWKSKKPVWEPLLARVELRGIAEGKAPRQFFLERAVPNPGGALSHWTDITLGGEDYKNFGSVTAWRVTLWEGQTLIGQQQSFLW
jgi:hypothetical protein